MTGARTAEAEPPRIWLHILLFVATVGTTVLGGALLGSPDPYSWNGLVQGVAYAAPLLFILLTHETGHYLAARRHGVPVSLPYFIPAPPIPFIIGTFGAFIRLRGRVPSRTALLDIGAAGPLAGMVVALPILFVGLHLSEVRALPPGTPGLQEGNSLLYLVAKWLVVGELPPGHDVILHPMAFAGWLGLFVTALNLLPVGQMDGGHIAYALLGDQGVRVTRGIPFALLALGFFTWRGWLLWGALLLFLGAGHPPLERFEGLARGRLAVGALAVVLLLATFVPVPLRITAPPGGASARAAGEPSAVWATCAPGLRPRARRGRSGGHGTAQGVDGDAGARRRCVGGLFELPDPQ